MIGQRIRQARLAARLSLDDVVDQLGRLGLRISKQSISNYERGKRVPKALTLIVLARLFGVNISFFMSEPKASIRWVGYRCQLRLGKRQRRQIEAYVRLVAERQAFLQETLFPNESPRLPKRRNVLSGPDAEEAAEELRACWELGNGPIDSLTQAVESSGGIVVRCTLRGVRFDGLSGYVNRGWPLIVVNGAVADDRLRFDIGHELGHLLIDTSALQPKDEERLAHRFAGALLVPRTAAFRELGRRRERVSLNELALLKKKYGLSMQAWLFRMRDLNIISEYSFRKAWREFGYRGWRKEEPVDFCGNERPTRLRQLTLRALAERIITPWDAEELCPGCTIRVGERERAVATRPAPADILSLDEPQRVATLTRAFAEAEPEYRDDPRLTDFEAFSEEDLVE